MAAESAPRPGLLETRARSNLGIPLASMPPSDPVSSLQRAPTTDWDRWKAKMEGVAEAGDSEGVVRLWESKPAQPSSNKAKEIEVHIDQVLLSAIFKTIQRGDLDTLGTLIRCKSKVLRQKYGTKLRTALHEAVEYNNRPVVQALLRHSQIIKGIDTRNRDGNTALHEAAKHGKLLIMGDLLANRADIDAHGRNHMSPLHFAVLECTKDPEVVVGFLLENAAEVNTRDSNGNSPLHEATRQAINKVLVNHGGTQEPENLLKLLLEYGADSGVGNAQGQTPRDLLELEQDNPSLDRLKQAFRYIQGRPHPKKTSRIPDIRPQCGTKHEAVSKEFSINVWFFWRKDPISWRSRRISVFDLVYKDGLQKLEDEYINFLKSENAEASRDEIWKWIHFPANNMTWIKACYCSQIIALGTELTEQDFVWSIAYPEDKFEQKQDAWDFLVRNVHERREQNCYTVRIPHAIDAWKSSVSSTNFRSSDDTPGPETLKESRMMGADLRTPINLASQQPDSNRKGDFGRGAWRDTADSHGNMSVVLPYIDFETEQYLSRHAADISDRSLPRQLQIMKQLEDLYRPFEGLSGHQGAQTLDQSYYTMLQVDDLSKRDEDQVVYKWFKSNPYGSCNTSETSHDSEFLVRPALLRHARTDLPYTPGIGASALAEGMAAPRGNQTHGNPGFREKQGPQEDSAEDYSSDTGKLLMIHQLWLWKLGQDTVITAFPERWHIGTKDSLLDTIRQSSGITNFTRPEQLIEHLLCECANFLDEFKYAGVGVHILDIFEGCIAARSNEETVCFKKFMKLVESKSNTGSIDEEVQLIYEVKDICDELHLIIRVMENQRRVLDSFSQIFWPGTEGENHREQFILDCGVLGLIARANRLKDDASRTLDSLDYLVQAKQAQFSLCEAESAGRLNNYIMLFTVVTVIFTPLSFMTSLFALPIQSFPSNETSGDVTFGGGWITGRLLAGEITTLAIILALIVFWHPGWIKSIVLSFRRRMHSLKFLSKRTTSQLDTLMDNLNQTVQKWSRERLRRPNMRPQGRRDDDTV